MSTLTIDPSINTRIRAEIVGNSSVTVQINPIVVTVPDRFCYTIELLLLPPTGTGSVVVPFVWPNNIRWNTLLSELLGTTYGNPLQNVNLRNDITQVRGVLVTLTTHDRGGEWLADAVTCIQ